MDEGYNWVWLIIQSNRKQNASNSKDFKHKVRLSMCECGNAQTSNLVETNELRMTQMGPTPCQFVIVD